MQSAFWANGYLYYIPFFNGTLGPSASVVNVTVNGDNTMTVQWESGVAFSASWVNFNVQLSWGAYGPITAANIQNGGTTNSTYTIASANYLPGTKLGTQGTLLASNNGGSNNGMSFSIKSGASKIVRFGPTATNSFNDTTAWRMFDLSTLFPTASTAVRNQLCCWTGAVVPGAPAMLIPWGVQINPVSGATYAYSNAVTLLFDSTLPFNNPAAWQYIDLSSITPPASSNYAGGYQYGIADRDGFAYFAPTHTYTNPIYTPTIPPWIQWDPRAPFANTSSWNLTRNTGYFNPATSTYVGEWSTGAGYSAYFNILVFAVYGTAPCRPPYATVGSCGSYSQELSAMELLVINDTGPGVHNSVPTKILGKMPTFPATLPAAIH
jgi:hypothetical protein